MVTYDKYLLEVQQTLNEKIKLANGMELYLAAKFNAEWNVTTNAIVKSVPLGIKNVKVGDDVAISYKVIAEKKYPSHATQFFPAFASPNGQKTIWLTARGWKLTKIKMPSTSNNQNAWLGILEHRGIWKDGCTGTESRVDIWLTQFPFGAAQQFFYRNMLEYNGNIYWRASKRDILAKKVKEEIIATADRVICKPIDTDVTDRENIRNGIVLKGRMMERELEKAMVVAAPKGAGLKKDDILGFEARFNEKYTLWDKEYFLIKQNFVHAIW